MLRKPIPPAKPQLSIEDERPPPLPKRVGTQPEVDPGSGAGGGDTSNADGEQAQAQMPIAKPLVKQRKGSQLMSPVWGGAGTEGGGADGGSGYFASRAASGASQGGAEGMREVEPRPMDEEVEAKGKPALPVRRGTGQVDGIGGDGAKGAGNQGLMDRDEEDVGGLAGWEVLTPR